MRTSLMVLVVSVLAVVALGACKGAPKQESKAAETAAGDERGACYGNGTCNTGLVCLSQMCVRPPGADCDKVAAKLSSFMLGNYAPRDQREAFLAQTRDECTTIGLTKEEGDCLLAAPHRNALGKCPRVIGLGDCPTIVAHLQSIRGGDPYVVTDADRLASRCKNETPSKLFETCVLGAKAVADLGRCVW